MLHVSPASSRLRTQSPALCSPLQHSLECWAVEGAGRTGSGSQRLAERLSQLLDQASGWIPTIWLGSFQSLDRLCDITRQQMQNEQHSCDRQKYSQKKTFDNTSPYNKKHPFYRKKINGVNILKSTALRLLWGT